MGLLAFLGRDFFPSIKSGEIDMHMRAPIGTRLEDASKIAVLVNSQIRKILPGQVTNLVDNCGLPVQQPQPGLYLGRHDRAAGLRHHDHPEE